MQTISVILFVAYTSLVAAEQHYHSQQNPVNTTSGSIIGHAVSNVSDVTEYLGIRYAQPATGQLRFAPPVPYTSGDIFYASSYSPDCPCNIAPVINYPPLTAHGSTILQEFLFQNTNHTQSEDCLSLNIWTRRSTPPHRHQPKAVLVFLHGGRFQIPGSHSPFYNGRYLAAAEDIVVVTINYRLVIFGYPGGTGLTQNVGLLDQRLAVEWIRDNIAAFGGDPSRITLWGQSVGGFSVDTYAYTYAADPIVHGLIADSGVAFNGSVPTWPYESNAYFLNVSSYAGCGTDSATAIPCMRGLPFQTILNASLHVHGTHLYQHVALPVFRPIVDNKTVFQDYVGLARAGAFAKLPFLAGGMNHESGFYRVTSYASNISMTDTQWAMWEAHNVYCPTLFEVYQRRQHGVRAWAFRYFGDWANLRLYNTSGAYHGTELDMVFGTAEDVAQGVENTPEEDQTVRYMMKAWAAFTKDPEHGLDALGWPLFDPDGPTLVRLGYNNTSGASFVNPSTYGQFCPSYADPMPDYGQPPFV